MLSMLVPGSTVYRKLPVYMRKAGTVHVGLVHCDCIV